MAWDDTKQENDDFLSSDWNSMVTDQKTRVVRTTGAGVPSYAPANIGDIYIDTTNNQMYIAYGTSDPSDFKRVLTE